MEAEEIVEDKPLNVAAGSVAALAPSDEGEYGVIEEIPLFERKSPINRISMGGNVYPEPADSPGSFASLDTSEILFRLKGVLVLDLFQLCFHYTGFQAFFNFLSHSPLLSLSPCLSPLLPFSPLFFSFCSSLPSPPTHRPGLRSEHARQHARGRRPLPTPFLRGHR